MTFCSDNLTGYLSGNDFGRAKRDYDGDTHYVLEYRLVGSLLLDVRPFTPPSPHDRLPVFVPVYLWSNMEQVRTTYKHTGFRIADVILHLDGTLYERPVICHVSLERRARGGSWYHLYVFGITRPLLHFNMF